MRFTWKEILSRSPEIAGLVTDAISIANNERWAWYPLWLPTAKIFNDAVWQAAFRLDLDPSEIRAAILTGLLDAYRTAKRPSLKLPKPRSWAKIH